VPRQLATINGVPYCLVQSPDFDGIRDGIGHPGQSELTEDIGVFRAIGRCITHQDIEGLAAPLRLNRDFRIYGQHSVS
jgi:hypothetical protein